MIETKSDPDVEIYWKRVFAQHNKEFAHHHSVGKAAIPDEWSKHTTEEIIQEIEEKYGIDTTNWWTRNNLLQILIKEMYQGFHTSP